MKLLRTTPLILRLLVVLILTFLPVSQLIAADSDSLQMRLYHGLDEIGAGVTFDVGLKNQVIWTKVYSRTNSLLRRPSGSFGELKTDGDFRAEIGRYLQPNLDIHTVFEGDYYSLQRFEGPAPLVQPVSGSPDDWLLEASVPVFSQPAQRINRSLLGIGGCFRPDTLMELTTIIGNQWEEREGFTDRGVAASLDGSLTDLEFKGYHNNLNVYLEQEELGDRMNREIRFNYGLDKMFSVNSSDRLEIYYRQKRHDYHIWGVNAIGTRLDTDQSIRNRLSYNFSPRVGFLLDTELVGSTHEDRTSSSSSLRDEVNTSNALTLQGTLQKFSGWTRIAFDWGAQEDHTGLKKQRGTTLEGGLIWEPNRSDSTAFTTAVRKRQFDTSDTTNFDDRDRLRYEFDLGYLHRFSPYFRAGIRTQVTMEHLVYIFAEKSDQNHWNRIFRLEPEVSFEPALDWHNRTHLELVANTTDYDFELDPANIKSNIYRRYTIEDSLVWWMDRGWSTVLNYGIDLEDGGRFLWDEWIQQRSEKYQTQRFTIILVRQTHTGIRFDTGFSVYERRGWEYSLDPLLGSVKSPFLYLSRWGPLLKLVYPSSSGINIQAHSDLSWVHEWGQEDYVIINLDIRVTWQ